MRKIESHEIFVGALVSWLHAPKGGYGYVFPVDAKVVQLNLQGDKVKIEVRTRFGRTVNRTVSVESLRWREPLIFS